jgi:hypothetical protein
MNKPIQVRGKRHTRGPQGTNPNDELKDILSGRHTPPISAGLTPGLPAGEPTPVSQPNIIKDLVGEPVIEREEAPQHRPLLDMGDGSFIQDGTDLQEGVAQYQAGDIVKAEDLVKAEVVDVVRDGVEQQEQAYRTEDESAEEPARVHAPIVEGEQLPETLPAPFQLETKGTDGIPSPEMHEKVGQLFTALADDDLYHPAGLEIIFTRLSKGLTDAAKDKMAVIINTLPRSITGLKTGFDLLADAKLKVNIEQALSFVNLDYVERKGKIISKFYVDWAERIAIGGLTDATTIDFFVVEPSEDGKEVLEAWHCKDMYPRFLTGIDHSRQEPGYRVESVGFEVRLVGKVTQSRAHLEEAKALWSVRHVIKT